MILVVSKQLLQNRNCHTFHFLGMTQQLILWVLWIILSGEKMSTSEVGHNLLWHIFCVLWAVTQWSNCVQQARPPTLRMGDKLSACKFVIKLMNIGHYSTQIWGPTVYSVMGVYQAFIQCLYLSFNILTILKYIKSCSNELCLVERKFLAYVENKVWLLDFEREMSAWRYVFSKRKWKIEKGLSRNNFSPTEWHVLTREPKVAFFQNIAYHHSHWTFDNKIFSYFRTS